MPRLLTRFSDAAKPQSAQRSVEEPGGSPQPLLLTLLPAEHHHPLLERLRASQAAGLGDSSERVIRRESVAYEPGADDDTGAPTASPAVDVHDTPGSKLVVDQVERLDEPIMLRDRKVPDRHADVTRRRNEMRICLQLSVVGEIEEERHAGGHEVVHFGPSVLRDPRARVTPGDQPTGLDDGRRAHDVTVCPGHATSSGGPDLNRPRAAADSSDMAPLETTDAVRDRALELAAEVGVEPGTWYMRMLEEGRSAGAGADLGALVRIYWELQRVTGRADLRDEWRRLADSLWSGEAA